MATWRLPQDYPMVTPWLPAVLHTGYQLVTRCLPDGSLTVASWCPDSFLLVTSWLPHGYLL
eukprot:11187312-Lingulodinium_polyedra.AAC.1